MLPPCIKSDLPQEDRLAQLHADVAAFLDEMHAATPADPREAWLLFGLGAGTAMLVFLAVFVIYRIA
jgi:hypothetical protein